ncbi:MAG: transporter substrate-binding domain-containing protein [Actinomycetia bacterium]|nr:transporter substrate-binding domain-containing protein [Actinomycetes bacterium]
MKKLVIALIITLLFINGCGKKEMKVRVVVDPTFIPMEFRENKELTGFDIELIKMIGVNQNLKLIFVEKPWIKLLDTLKKGEADLAISAITITAERTETFSFSNPYLKGGQILVIRKDNPDIIMIIKDMAGKKVGVQEGTTGAIALKSYKKVIPVEFPEIEAAFSSLISNEVSGVVVDWPIASNYVNFNDQFKGKLKIIGAPITSERLGIAVNPDNHELLKRVNNGINFLKKNRKIEKLIKKWL